MEGQTKRDLSVTVHRVQPPVLHCFRDQNKFDLNNDTGSLPCREEALNVQRGRSFPKRIEQDVSTSGITNCLAMCKEFGAIYIGQKMQLRICINNVSSSGAHTVTMKVEIQHDRGKRVLFPPEGEREHGMFDLAPGQGHQLMVQYDVIELGNHTVLISCQYYDDLGEQRYQPQSLKFLASNPLMVKTKVRWVSLVCLFS